MTRRLAGYEAMCSPRRARGWQAVSATHQTACRVLQDPAYPPRALESYRVREA